MLRPRFRWELHRRVLVPVVHAVWPSACTACRETLGARQLHGVCLDCWAQVRPIAGPACRRCGIPTAAGSGSSPCGRCVLDPPEFESCRAAVVYGGPARDVLLRAKFGRRPEILHVLGRQLATALRRDAAELGCGIVVPVPSHPLSRVARGFDPAREIGRPVAAMLRLPLLAGAMRRRIGTASRAKRLRATERRRSLRDAFVAHPHRVEGRRVLLIDDVLTTGATADAATRALRSAGAIGVRLAVWGRVPVDGPGSALAGSP